jgi:hypothetical protein
VDTSATGIASERAWGALHPLIASTLSDAGVPYDCAVDLCSELRPWVEACRGGFRTEASVPSEVRPKFEAAAAILLRFLHETNLEFVSRLIDREIDYHTARRKPFVVVR